MKVCTCPPPIRMTGPNVQCSIHGRPATRPAVKRWEDRAAQPLPTELLNDLWVALTGEDLGARPEAPQFWWNKALDRVRSLARSEHHAER